MLFVHLSDIHFKEIHVDREDDPNRGLRNDLIRDVRKMRAEIGRDADGILLSGDIAHAGKAKEYEFALKWLESEHCPTAGCKLRDVFVIPGNHDVDREAGKSPVHAMARDALRDMDRNEVEERIRDFMRDEASSKVIFDPIENYNRFAANFLCSLGPYNKSADHIVTRPYSLRNLRLNDGSTLRLLGFNSVLVSSKDDEMGNMLVDPTGAQIEHEDGVTYLVLCHHPFSWLNNGGPFRDRLESIAHIHLFGHEHIRRVEKGDGFVRINSGAVQPDRDDPDWKPGYNWIDVQVEHKQESRFLNLKIWVRLHDVRPAQFLAVPGRKGDNPWNISLDLDPWQPNAAIVDDVEESEFLDILDQTVDPTKPPVVDVRDLALKIMQLRVDQQEKVMQSLGLNDAGDRNLRDFELGIAAVRRSIERNKLVELDAELNRILAKH